MDEERVDELFAVLADHYHDGEHIAQARSVNVEVGRLGMTLAPDYLETVAYPWETYAEWREDRDAIHAMWDETARVERERNQRRLLASGVPMVAEDDLERWLAGIDDLFATGGYTVEEDLSEEPAHN